MANPGSYPLGRHVAPPDVAKAPPAAKAPAAPRLVRSRSWLKKAGTIFPMGDGDHPAMNDSITLN
jgi:hypothetical protein